MNEAASDKAAKQKLMDNYDEETFNLEDLHIVWKLMYIAKVQLPALCVSTKFAV